MVERPPHRVPRCARCEVTNAIKRNTHKKKKPDTGQSRSAARRQRAERRAARTLQVIELVFGDVEDGFVLERSADGGEDSLLN